MTRRTLLVLAGLTLAATSAVAETADAVIAKHIAALGGLNKLKAVGTMRLTGTMTMGPEMAASFTIEMKRPNKTRMDMVVQGLSVVHAYDGVTAWGMDPGHEAAKLSEDEAQEAADDADFDGPLVDHGAKGNRVELLGREKVGGADAYKLRVTLKSGAVSTIYLDTVSFLEVKSQERSRGEGEGDVEILYGDYRLVSGIMVPHSQEGGPKGSPVRMKMTVDKVEVNPTIDDSRFAMPTWSRD